MSPTALRFVRICAPAGRAGVVLALAFAAHAQKPEADATTHAPYDSLQQRGASILQQMVEVNRYWLLAPPGEVARYSYTVGLKDNAEQSVEVSNPDEVDPAMRSGVTYQTAMRALAPDPAGAIINDLSKEGGVVRIQFRFATPVKGACGNGVSGRWRGYFNLNASEGTLWLDAATYTPLELVAGDVVERYSKYVTAGHGQVVPLRIEIDRVHPGDKGMHFDWRFRLYEPGLWLLDQAHYALGNYSEPELAAEVTNVQVNTANGVAGPGLPIETRVLAETAEARAHRAATARGQSHMDAVIDANRTWLRPSLEARRGLAYDYRQEGVYRERVVFDSEGRILVQLEGERDGPEETTRQRLYLPDGTGVIGTYGEPYVHEMTYPETDKDRIEKLAQRDRHRLNLATGLGWDCALTRMARSPSDFLATVEPGEDGSTYRLILRSRNRETKIFAGTMLMFTSWAYMHDVRFARSEILCDAVTHRPISEMDYDRNGALVASFHFSDYIEGPECAPGRITALIPYEKDDLEQPLEMEANFAFARPGVWLLKKLHSEFRGQGSGSTGEITVLPEEAEYSAAIAAIRSRLTATRALIAKSATLSTEPITLPVTSAPNADLWTRADAAALDADPRILLHAVSTETVADGLRVTVEIVSTANWVAHDVEVEATQRDEGGGAIGKQTVTVNVRAKQTLGVAEAALTLTPATGARTVEVSAKVTALTAEFYGRRWIYFVSPAASPRSR